MAKLTLENDTASIVVDPLNGGRLASLEIEGIQYLVVQGDAGPLQWGSYPMVPWAGRIRNGKFRHGDEIHEMPRNLPPHAAHGVGFTAAWEVDDDHTIVLDLPPPWPFGGRATQRFELDDDGLTVTMTVLAETSMPVMVGWHPWFRRFLDGGSGPVEAEVSFGPGLMYELDDTAIPTGRLRPPPPGPWDNCFTSLEAEPTIQWPGVGSLALTSSLDHWVVFTEPERALCVEPQSGAPDEFNREPVVLASGEEVVATFRLGWA